MIPTSALMCESGGMRKGIEVRLGPGDRERLEAVIASGNSPQKHVWRARIVLLSAAGVGTMAIQRQTGKAKPTIWRWQARFMAERVDGLLHEATRPAGKPPLTPTNDNPKPFIWTADPDAIIEKVRRGKVVLAALLGARSRPISRASRRPLSEEL